MILFKYKEDSNIFIKKRFVKKDSRAILDLQIYRL